MTIELIDVIFYYKWWIAEDVNITKNLNLYWLSDAARILTLTETGIYLNHFRLLLLLHPEYPFYLNKWGQTPPHLSKYLLDKLYLVFYYF